MTTPLPRELTATMPRIKRGVIALVTGVVAMLAVYYVAYLIVQPDPHGTGAWYRNGEHKLVLYPAMSAAIAAAALTLVLLEVRAAKKWRREGFADARVVKR